MHQTVTSWVPRNRTAERTEEVLGLVRWSLDYALASTDRAHVLYGSFERASVELVRWLDGSRVLNESTQSRSVP